MMMNCHMEFYTVLIFLFLDNCMLREEEIRLDWPRGNLRLVNRDFRGKNNKAALYLSHAQESVALLRREKWQGTFHNSQ